MQGTNQLVRSNWGVRRLAQGHFDTPRVGSNRQPSRLPDDCSYLLSHITPLKCIFIYFLYTTNVFTDKCLKLCSYYIVLLFCASLSYTLLSCLFPVILACASLFCLPACSVYLPVFVSHPATCLLLRPITHPIIDCPGTILQHPSLPISCLIYSTPFS